MSHDASHHIVPYKTYGIVLAILLMFTALSIGAIYFNLGALGVFIALLLASIKSSIVLIYFMHLKFDSLFLRIMVSAVFVVVAIVIFITLLDYFYR